MESKSKLSSTINCKVEVNDQGRHILFPDATSGIPPQAISKKRARKLGVPNGGRTQVLVKNGRQIIFKKG